MRMIKPLHQSDLSPDALLPLYILNPLFLIDFQRHFLIKLLVHANSNYCIGTLTYLLSYDIVTQTMFVRKNDLLLLLRGGGQRWTVFFGGPDLEVGTWSCGLGGDGADLDTFGR